jgi:hypothetical protein
MSSEEANTPELAEPIVKVTKKVTTTTTVVIKF